ncbi:Transcriptional regulator, contains XRE-family HTH domain [Rathayibacter oskolensis]|uniref:Transcriptional regulator, contains XRE-family HTH domain n=1 Tax=Rathayibacter oskolensis TaxID=1891671 RepID=A0A1X7NZU8_9MICO|nr:Transcriptional regulator, contains XRE-family HTH domain [Rathayibacter oskolensis]
MTGAPDDVGDFLRSRRAALSPGDVGLAGGRHGRRVTGLRREEVAVLADVSADYYARLEQGRERNPSPQMLNALSRALRLSSDSRAHLYRLVGLNPQLTPDSSRNVAHPELLTLLDAFPLAAAYVLGPDLDVLATNPVADALLSPFGGEPSMPRIHFTHPLAKTIYPEWDLMARAIVHALRLNLGLIPGDPGITAVAAELEERSSAFRTLWREQGVAGLTRATKRLEHPEAGTIELTYQAFDVRDAPGQQLFVGTPAKGSPSEQSLAYLASMRPASSHRE